MIELIYDFDFGILNALQSVRTPFSDAFMTAVTYTGSGGIVWILLAFAIIVFARKKRAGIKILVGLLMGLLIGNLITKNIVMRERPFALSDIAPVIPPPSDRYSFPSGHTLSSYIAAWLSFGFSKKVGTAATIFASLIAFSRLYLYVHFPTDVLGAILMSVPIALAADKLTDIVIKKINKKRKPKKNEYDSSPM